MFSIYTGGVKVEKSKVLMVEGKWVTPQDDFKMDGETVEVRSPFKYSSSNFIDDRISPSDVKTGVDQGLTIFG